MTNHASIISTLVAATTISLTVVDAGAAMMVVSSSALFDGIVASMSGTVLHEDFAGYSGYYESGLAGGSGDSSWTAAGVGGLYAGGGIMSTNHQNAPLTFTFANNNVFAIGGDFFNTNADFSSAGGFVSAEVNGVSYVFASASDNSFTGFISTSGAIHSITISTFGSGSNGTFASSNHVVVGVIPSPAVLALGAMAGLIARRRRN
ncbi:MAG: hypothetical protein EXS15_07345 [Phycisphaerales bacterium]|nr:hypothetical protein [Phycisphaerales bacterium]